MIAYNRIALKRTLTVKYGALKDEKLRGKKT